MWGGTQRGQPEQGHRVHFNPPSPCGEGQSSTNRECGSFRISIHPPRVGRDAILPAPDFTKDIFQSTLPVWGGTWRACGNLKITVFQSTLPVWGGTLNGGISHTVFPISIHPPRVGRDPLPPETDTNGPNISIHPPRVGRDLVNHRYYLLSIDFNPPSPCGEGRRQAGIVRRAAKFQSTLPVWGGTFAS